MTEFVLTTYNLQGFNSDRSMFTNLFVKTDIICLQEHGLCQCKPNMMKTANNDFHTFAVYHQWKMVSRMILFLVDHNMVAQRFYFDAIRFVMCIYM